MKTSFIATVYNEEKSIKLLVESLLRQTKKPDEIIIVDGGSVDNTVKILRTYPEIKLYVKKGNRSVGRNYAISKAKHNLILISDAGCILNKKWVEQISKPFESKNIQVVAGYYRAKAETVLQKAVTPYVLVMPDRVRPNNFLPATRSMAILRDVWEGIGKFNPKLSDNEDYEFSRRLSESEKITFVKNAIVYWIPPDSYARIFWMFFRFARGDAQAGIIRRKVILIFIRYTLILFLLGIYLSTRELVYLFILLSFGVLYIAWSILKNYHYVRSYGAVFLLPLLQFVSDGAVLVGTVIGLRRRILG